MMQRGKGSRAYTQELRIFIGGRAPEPGASQKRKHVSVLPGDVTLCARCSGINAGGPEYGRAWRLNPGT
jgi:hypothetical protein